MYFEQALLDNWNYFHQNRNGWLQWCDTHFHCILSDFRLELPEMTRFNQRYFGDWVDYHGKSDVGYYLGAKFVQFLRGKYSFEHLIQMDIEEVYKEFLTWLPPEVPD